MKMRLMARIAEVSPRLVQLMAGEQRHSRWFSEEGCAAAEPNKLTIISAADHVALYGRPDVIPSDRPQSFFEQRLA